MTPLVIAAAAAGIVLVRHERDTIERDAIGRARATMTAVDAELRGAISSMNILVSSKHLQAGDLRAFHEEARRVLASQPYWLNVGLVSATKTQLFNAILPFGSPAPNAADQGTLDEVIRTGKLAIGNVATGPAITVPSVRIQMPIIRDGAVRYVLSVPLKLELFTEILRAQKVPAEWVIVLVDRNRRFIARIPPRPPGDPISDSFRAALDRAPDGFFRGQTVEGVPTYTPYVTSASSGWVLGIAVPQSIINAGVIRLAAMLSAGLAAALAIAGWLAWSMSTRIAGPIGALAAATRDIEPGSDLVLQDSGKIEEIVHFHQALRLGWDHVRERQRLLEQERNALRLSEERLEQRTAELQTMLDIVPVGLGISHDARGDRISVNSHFERILGLQPGQNASATGSGNRLPYRCLRDGKEIPGEELPMQVASRTGKEVRDVEFDVQLASGELIHLIVSAAPLFDALGHVRGAIGAHVDVTRLKQAEVALRAANRAKDEFLAMLGHELRNPLGAIVSAAGLLTGTGASGPTAERARSVIARQVQHLSRLVDDLLDVSRVTAGKIVLLPQPIDLAALVTDALAGWRSSGRFDRHHVSVDASPVWVEADETRLEQVFGNLLGNALKYTPAGGTISIRVGAEAGTAVLQVADTGIGIPPALVDRVFDLFVQGESTLDRAQGGLGLGLTLVRVLVERHGGTVEASSPGPGKGAAFTVRLPRVPTPVHTRTVVSTAPADMRSRRILVVEDNADAREMLRTQLALAGHEVREAADGQTALGLVTTHCPDIVLVDIGLPGMDGYEIARRVRASDAGKSVLLVALTGYGQAEDRRKALAAGFDVHLTKPVSPERLAAVINQPASSSSERLERRRREQ